MKSLTFQGFTSSQLQMVEDNTVYVEQREKEINQIVRSIQDLNEIFKDLATMVVDQVPLLYFLYLCCSRFANELM